MVGQSPKNNDLNLHSSSSAHQPPQDVKAAPATGILRGTTGEEALAKSLVSSKWLKSMNLAQQHFLIWSMVRGCMLWSWRHSLQHTMQAHSSPASAQATSSPIPTFSSSSQSIPKFPNCIFSLALLFVPRPQLFFSSPSPSSMLLLCPQAFDEK